MKKTINYFCLVMALCLMVISGCSCSTPKPAHDPLAGFHWSSLNNLDSNKVITGDYKAYIRSLSPEESSHATVDNYYEGGTGQHWG